MPTIDLITPSMAVVTLLACVAFVHLLGLSCLAEAKSGRLASIDGLRGFLSIAVFIHHFYINYNYKMTGQWVAPTSSTYNLFGSSGVSLFFMVTGYLFFGKVRAVRGHLDLNRFYFGRFFRIIPVYVVSVGLVYLSTFAANGFYVGDGFPESLDQWIFFHAPLINGYPFSPLINAGVIWTLTYEWIFYFSIPVIAVIWLRLGLRSWAIALAVILALYFQRNAVMIPYIDMNSGLFAPFVLGGLAGEVGRVVAVRRFALSRTGAALSIAALAALFTAFSTAYMVSAYLTLFIFFVPIALGNSLFGLLRLRAVRLLGEISYDIYMLHGIVLFALFTLAMPHALQDAHSPGRILSLMLIAAGGVVLSSVVIHLAVERPMMRFGRTLVPIDSVQALAAP